MQNCGSYLCWSTERECCKSSHCSHMFHIKWDP
uniref:Uncharacterized protein n=1 Tax=Rhizophora mucronata TaxID=61149 RepID=A0A2P2QUU1_RHIMU